MALQGTIKDFGLPDILQLIGIQRKTGTLRLDRQGETVSVKFLEGNIVEADTGAQDMEDLIGNVLQRTGKVSERQLSDALKIQKKTLQRLGHILIKSGAITEEELVEALRVQSLQIVYRLFRWHDGRYNFETAQDVDYDHRHFSPIGAETVLMEGARMVDEWPLIERRIRSDNMVLRRVEEAIDEAQGQMDPVASTPPLGEEERGVLDLVDGKSTVQQINDHSPLGEFDTYRILADLITSKLLEEVEVVHAVQRRRSTRLLERIVGGLMLLAMIGAGAAAALTLEANPWSPWKLAAQESTTNELRFYASMNRLSRIEQALRMFYLDRGRYPADIELLASNGYLGSDDLLDPWSRHYGYSLSEGGYQLVGLDAGGQAVPQLSISYRFSSVQQMILSGSGPSEAPAGP